MELIQEVGEREPRKEESVTLNNYETVFILPADYTPQRVDEFIEKLKEVVTKGGGEFTLVDKWGRRRLAYPIKRHREGFYVFIMFKAPGAVLAEVNRFFRVSEDIVRDILCKALEGKPGSPTMSVPATLLQTATAPYTRPIPVPAGAPAPAVPGAPVAGAPVPAAPAAAPEQPKEVPHELPPAPAPAQ